MGPFRFCRCSEKSQKPKTPRRPSLWRNSCLGHAPGKRDTLAATASSIRRLWAFPGLRVSNAPQHCSFAFLRNVQIAVGCSRTTWTEINICTSSQQDSLVCCCYKQALRPVRPHALACHIHASLLSTGAFSQHPSVPRSAGNFAWKFTRSQSFSHCFWLCVWCTSKFRGREPCVWA